MSSRPTASANADSQWLTTNDQRPVADGRWL